MSTRAKNREKKIISKSLNRQIGLYSVAAAVAGVSMLALAEPAVGEVIVTKKTLPVPVGTESNPKPLYLSMANNGINNISLSLTQDSFNPGRTILVDTVDPKNDRIVMGGTWDPYALALAQGAKIGPSNANFSYGGLVEFSATSNGVKYCKGYWAAPLQHFIGCGTPKNKYMGVSFVLNGKTHYGWIRLVVRTTSDKNGPPLTATVTEYAYEGVANETINAGSTTSTAEVPAENVQKRVGPSLGSLAAGAEGMPLWRREETESSK